LIHVRDNAPPPETGLVVVFVGGSVDIDSGKFTLQMHILKKLVLFIFLVATAVIAIPTASYFNARISENKLKKHYDVINKNSLLKGCAIVIQNRAAFTNEAVATYDFTDCVAIYAHNEQFNKLPLEIRDIHPSPGVVTIFSNKLAISLDSNIRATIFCDYSDKSELSTNNIYLTIHYN
jgi:hypothetical protein